MTTEIRTLVTGGTGNLGQALIPRLVEAGHVVRATSRSPPPDEEDVEWVELDLTTDDGFQRVIHNVDVVIHAASDAVGDAEAVDVDGTERLLGAAESASVSNFVYISIVGIEEIPYSYYRHKLTAERLIEASAVPSTILRATQFFAFLDEIGSMLTRVPVWPLETKMQLQPVGVDVVAKRLGELATAESSGRVDPVGGPAVQTVGELAESYRDSRGLWRPIVRVPIPGKVFSAFRAGKATCPGYAVASETWEEYLETRYRD